VDVDADLGHDPEDHFITDGDLGRGATADDSRRPAD
jgi:hypothetical protein